MKILSGILVASASLSLRGAAQAPPPAKARDGVLAGIVTNLNGVPLPKTEVFIVATDLRTVTNDSGVYEFLATPTGKLRVIARRIGFEPDERSVNVESNKQKQLDFELKGIPEQLDSVMVREAGGRGRLSEFWSRRMVGNGAFITREDIDRRKPLHPSDLLRTVAGVRVLTASGLDYPTITMGRLGLTIQSPVRTGVVNGAGNCRVTYYVDGNYVASGTFHMDDISPSMVEALEVYRGPAETPVRFRQRDTACGVIVIWTRDPSRRDPGAND